MTVLRPIILYESEQQDHLPQYHARLTTGVRQDRLSGNGLNELDEHINNQAPLREFVNIFDESSDTRQRLPSTTRCTKRRRLFYVKAARLKATINLATTLSHENNPLMNRYRPHQQFTSITATQQMDRFYIVEHMDQQTH
ncbi:unnamed protein product [Absidia cylindrospora]